MSRRPRGEHERRLGRLAEMEVINVDGGAEGAVTCGTQPSWASWNQCGVWLKLWSPCPPSLFRGLADAGCGAVINRCQWSSIERNCLALSDGSTSSLDNVKHPN